MPSALHAASSICLIRLPSGFNAALHCHSSSRRAPELAVITAGSVQRRQSCIRRVGATAARCTLMRLLMAACAVQALTPPTTPTTPVVLEPPPPLEILYEGDAFAIVAKPGGVPCHASEYIGKDYVVPLLQRARDALGRRVNLVHRLDRGASGCVICAYADLEDSAEVTTALGEALAAGQKTYVALVRGEGFLREDLCEAAGADVNTGDLKREGWFVVDRPIKDDRGRENNATTTFKFVASTGSEDAARASLVAARPATGRWHQIRRHLNGLSHPILGDSSHWLCGNQNFTARSC